MYSSLIINFIVFSVLLPQIIGQNQNFENSVQHGRNLSVEVVPNLHGCRIVTRPVGENLNKSSRVSRNVPQFRKFLVCGTPCECNCKSTRVPGYYGYYAQTQYAYSHLTQAFSSGHSPQCSKSRACVNQRCVDPCSGACGISAHCKVVDHFAQCYCPNGWVGDGRVECRRVVESRPISVVECEYDEDCPLSKFCVSTRCVDPCRGDVCGHRALCKGNNHRAICSCPPGMTGNPQFSCSPTIGCESNDDCGGSEACINRDCRNPCEYTGCGSRAECVPKYHRESCRCPIGFKGDPMIACAPPECTVNQDCPIHLACVKQKCVDPCNCAPTAKCTVFHHQPTCECPPGTTGNPTVLCAIGPTTCGICGVAGCKSDEECPSKLACINRACVDPCLRQKPCGVFAECGVLNTLPSRLMTCTCLPGYFGDALLSCSRPDPLKIGCSSDADCGSEETCRNRECVNPCRVLNPCASNAECRVNPASRRAECHCPAPLKGDPFRFCYPEPVPECTKDEDCADAQACVSHSCVDPCSFQNSCAKHAVCKTLRHRPTCTCPIGLAGDPYVHCYKPGCRNDDECPDDKRCLNERCVDPCLHDRCPPTALCRSESHRAQCYCPPGTQGNPRVNCIPVGCMSNEDCAGNERCERKSGKCVLVCIPNGICTSGATCEGINHLPICTCPHGTIGDPYEECKVPEKPGRECETDPDCHQLQMCVNGGCVNPCLTKANPCSKAQECRVANSYPISSVICECPPDTVQTSNGICVKVELPPPLLCEGPKGFVRNELGICYCPPPLIPENGTCILPRKCECKTDSDCPDQRACVQFCDCRNPCATKICRPNEDCIAINHEANCICLPGFVRNSKDNVCRIPILEFPPPEMEIVCLRDGILLNVRITNGTFFNGLMYVKGYSAHEECRKSILSDYVDFKVNIGSCGLYHSNGLARYRLVIQKHGTLVTYRAQSFDIKCLYSTGERKISADYGFWPSSTAGTIANAGPPPTCTMKILASNGGEIGQAEVGETLLLQVEVEPSSIYGGFARNCIAKTAAEDSQWNSYIVTGENGCAIDPGVFEEWDVIDEKLQARFHAFKFTASDTIQFDCDIRVCFGKCQPVNCGGLNAFGRKKRQVSNELGIYDSDQSLSSYGREDDEVREEVKVSSNPIFAIDVRPGGLDARPSKPEKIIQDSDICISTLSIIISILLTAALTLVALFILIACFLLARRRLSTSPPDGPLSHPQEFPNPILRNHETSTPIPR